VDLRAAARRKLGTLGDPADLIVREATIIKALRLMPRRLFRFVVARSGLHFGLPQAE
jgi:hypothetical protein